jgi:hypothetical protein
MPIPGYLQPYLKAAERHGGKFESLLWANPRTQAVRFAALVELCDLNNRVVVDAGCGRADLLDYLLNHRINPARYIGIEAVEALAHAAEKKQRPNSTLLRGDFVHDPSLMDRRTDVIVFCGSLNTLNMNEFHRTLRAAWGFARRAVAFNFLCSPRLASGEHLTWHGISDVLAFANELTPDVALDDSYRNGDCTMEMRKSG